MEQVLVLIKPDAMQRGIGGEVLDQFTSKGARLIALKMVKPSVSLARKHYELLKDKFFYGQIVDYLTGKFHKDAPVIVMVLEGSGVVKKCRDIAGATNPEEADSQSVRGKFGRITTKGLFENVVHVSSSSEESQREIKLWFKKSELL